MERSTCRFFLLEVEMADRFGQFRDPHVPRVEQDHLKSLEEEYFWRMAASVALEVEKG